MSGGLRGHRGSSLEEVQPGLGVSAVGLAQSGRSDVRRIVQMLVGPAERVGPHPALPQVRRAAPCRVAVGLRERQTHQQEHVVAAVNRRAASDPHKEQQTCKVEVCGGGGHLPGQAQ